VTSRRLRTIRLTPGNRIDDALAVPADHCVSIPLERLRDLALVRAALHTRRCAYPACWRIQLPVHPFASLRVGETYTTIVLAASISEASFCLMYSGSFALLGFSEVTSSPVLEDHSCQRAPLGLLTLVIS